LSGGGSAFKRKRVRGEREPRDSKKKTEVFQKGGGELKKKAAGGEKGGHSLEKQGMQGLRSPFGDPSSERIDRGNRTLKCLGKDSFTNEVALRGEVILYRPFE